MHLSLLDILRCPYCGGRLDLVPSMFHQRDGDEIHDAILGCHCCILPVIAGIPVMHLEGAATPARAHVEAGRAGLGRAVAGRVLRGGGRALDICGGSGHLTRSLMDLSSPPPVLADLYFSKIWLARRFIAPGCEAVCCDGNAPLPFARGAFPHVVVAG